MFVIRVSLDPLDDNSDCSLIVFQLVSHREVVASVFEDSTFCHLVPGAIQLNNFDLSTQTIVWATFFLGFYLNIEINKGPLANKC